jgi:hypothetical protein
MANPRAKPPDTRQNVGVLALTGPLARGNVLLLAAFGEVHVVLGALIVRRHGG